MTDEPQHFRLCSSCRTPLPFGEMYYVCSVSTCNRKRTGLTFCSMPCYDAHLPEMRHRSSWAEEERAPTVAAFTKQQAEEADKERQRSRSADTASATAPLTAGELPIEMLIVVSKLKKYVKARSGMNTSESAMDALSDIVRAACDCAVREAGRDGRRTVMDRDFAGLKNFPRNIG